MQTITSVINNTIKHAKQQQHCLASNAMLQTMDPKLWSTKSIPSLLPTVLYLWPNTFFQASPLADECFKIFAKRFQNDINSGILTKEWFNVFYSNHGWEWVERNIISFEKEGKL